MLSRLAPRIPLASSSRAVLLPALRTARTALISPIKSTRIAVATHSSFRAFSSTPIRGLATLVEEEAFDFSTVERVTDEVDVCIVGAGPAGLSAAIKLKQLANAEGKELRVIILEKGPEVGW